MNELQTRLERAISGGKEELLEFYRCLLRSELFVPHSLTEPSQLFSVSHREIPQGELSYGEVNHREQSIVPAFSATEFLGEWSALPLPSERLPFSALLWRVRDDQWIHLDPGQLVGKQLDPWEITLLRKGVDALEEIVAEIHEGFDSEVTIEPQPAGFFELERRLRVMLEAYKFVEEAFLAESVGEGNSGVVIGLKLSDRSEKVDQLRREIGDLVREETGSFEHQIIDDLADPASPQWSIFRQSVPFYIVQRPGKRSIVERVRGFWRGERKSDRS